MTEPKIRIDLTSFLKFLDNNNGRDKLSKFIQYSARFVKWEIGRFQPEKKELMMRFASLEKGTANARKLVRLFRSLSYLQKIYQTLVNKKGELQLNLTISQLLTILSAIGWANYFWWDHFVWFSRIGVLKIDEKPIQKWSFYGWFFGLLFAIIQDTILLGQGINKERKLPRESSDAIVIRKERRKLYWNYVKNLADLCIAAQGAGITSRFSEGWLGICGCVSALVGAYELWPRS